jgi:hypothetical protein
VQVLLHQVATCDCWVTKGADTGFDLGRDESLNLG